MKTNKERRVLISNLSKDCLKKLEDFLSGRRKEKIRITLPKDKFCIGIYIDLNDLSYYFASRPFVFCCGVRLPCSQTVADFREVDNFIYWYEKRYLPLENLVLIKHIPHASLRFPDCCDFSNNIEKQKYNLKMSDVGIDALFSNRFFVAPVIPEFTIKAKYSRLYCDVERFKNDKDEPMSKLGQGMRYRKFYDGKDFNRFDNPEFDDLIEEYYDEHHKRLNDLVRTQVQRGKDVLILDLHSYSDELADSIGNKGPYPDVCIGINDDFKNKPLLDLIISKIEQKGLSYKINFPYKGAIVPSDVMNGKIKGNVYSIMIEVNKRVYL